MLRNTIAPDSGKKVVLPNDTAASVSVQTIAQPRFLRLPKPGTLCPFTGLSRTQIYVLCKTGKVKSFSLKRRGTSRGCRLIDAESLVRAIQEFSTNESAVQS